MFQFSFQNLLVGFKASTVTRMAGTYNVLGYSRIGKASSTIVVRARVCACMRVCVCACVCACVHVCVCVWCVYFQYTGYTSMLRNNKITQFIAFCNELRQEAVHQPYIRICTPPVHLIRVHS